mmetsp:Transcript_12346/g.15653  ORF Transcript_12346/g.15653 Transcript_12346/m.15653 type:complete len:231 (-) Transcript_12346:211-903(-)
MISIRQSIFQPCRTTFLVRGTRHAKGRGWYKKYKEEGDEGFRRASKPNPFDWEDTSFSGLIDLSKRSKVFFKFSIDGEEAGDIQIELAEDILPKTCENFKLLCSQQNPHGFTYKGTPIHRVIKGSALMGGDVEHLEGKGNHSAFQQRYFEDEGFVIPHSEPGLLSMASSGVHTNGSQFYLTVAPAPHLDGRCVAFGRVLDGMATINKIYNLYSMRGKFAQKVEILESGIV